MITSFNQIRLTNNIINASGGRLTLVGSGGYVYQSETGGFYPSSNPSGYINAAQAGGVSSLSVTGFSLSGVVSLSGVSGVNVYTGSSTSILIGINTGILTGQFYPLNTNPSGYVTTSQTGVFATAAALGATGNLFTTFTGNAQNFTTSITPTGNASYFIQFPFNFGSTPKVQATLEVTGNFIYSIAVQNKTVSGYTALFSDFIQESGVTIDTYATINS